MIKTGFAKRIITPPRGISLAGYFNARPNRGAFDDLCVKTVLFQTGSSIGGIVNFDLCFVSSKMVNEMKQRLKKEKIDFADKLLFCATHTHTGPHVSNFFNSKANPDYMKYLFAQTIASIKMACANISDSELYFGSVDENPFAFNRRYFMKSGNVVTNPGKLNSEIVKPEGKVDTEIGIASVKQDGRTTLIIANIVNHSDTVGGDIVSADWPGRMEKEIQNKIGYDVPVITLIGASGNINHFDVSTKRNQTSYKEACRIGKGYADIVFKQLKNLKPVTGNLKVAKQTLKVIGRKISEKDAKEAREILKKNKGASSSGDMTSEGLAKGEGAIACFFADQLLKFKKTQAGKTRDFALTTLKFGKDLAVTSLPGEPFTEIGMEIKKSSPFKKTFVVSHGNGKAGYIPLKECFGRGGYETMPVQNGGCDFNTAEKCIKSSLKNLK